MTSFGRLRNRVLEILGMGTSIVVAWILINAASTIVLMFAGKLGPSELGGVGLAISLTNLTCLAVSAGMSSASETLFSQAYGTANKKQVGLYMQRSIIFFAVASVVFITVNINCDLLFTLMGQDPVLACIARRFLIFSAPGFLFFFAIRLIISYLRVQDVYWPIIVSPGIGCVSLIILCVILLDYGVEGIALAHSGSFFITTTTTVAYMLWSKPHIKTWPEWSLKVFENWGQLAKLCVAGLALTASEYFFLEVVTLLAGTMDEIVLGAQSIVFQIFNTMYVVSLGFSLAGAVKIGTALGANDPKTARGYVGLSLMVTFTVQAVVVILVLALRYQLMYVFTTDTDVAELGSRILLVVCLEQMVEVFYKIFCSAIKGAGRQGIGSVANFICMYVIGIPILLSTNLILGWGIIECWFVYAAVYILLSIIFFIIMICTNWDKEADKARERMGLDMPSDDLELNKFGKELEDELKPLLTKESEPEATGRWRSFTETVGSSSKQTSKLDLYVPPDKPSDNPRSLIVKRVAIVIFILLSTCFVLSLNLTGVLSIITVFGQMSTFVNSTSVEACRHLLT